MMFEWLFGRKNPKTLTEIFQETEIKGNGNRVVQTTRVVNQRGAKAKGDIVGGNKYSAPYNPNTDMLNPLNPLNPAYQPDYTPPKHSHSHDSSSSSHSHSHDSGSSSSHSHSSSGSSSYDSGSSSSYDSGSSSSYDSSSY